MVYKFRIITDENDKFSMDIEIKSTQTFFDLHTAIQDEAEWDNSQLASFFLCNNLWEKSQEFSLLDMSDGDNNDVVVMEKGIIGNHIKKLKDKLVYVFDFFNERFFYIELIEIKPENANKYYPLCSNYVGDIPSQIKISKTKVSKSLFASEFDSDNEGEAIDEFDDDELLDDEVEKDFDESDYFEEDGRTEEEKY